ncbi:uncharacterized protein Z520_04633 [Fonsecaea multimorphosa CBS 102226]|uniref:Histone transcription regulator 3 homolog n=1 Tax=Fonsecaea multimorphosa CBS 102226 TaxID=1442371 RepID=A0A0D2HDN2_9EURO|nr:uncharacterized protein Z520_04633 [Fonsecaea multimorphosa CBS 102226]KIX99995.1 hypothetical protein Z520_04633 [Fonsecaea multimorphosa CBS 102226]OAL26208.1 hypothetical protein AYO22_04386 [Fonsecaea multimorphosa]
MSAFTALNVEPEDTFEEEIDDTREIQLEEAFKLYQNALKLHSQGPEYFQEAKDAYDELLRSEVFKYPDVVSDFQHDELDDEATIAAAQVDPGALALLPSSAAESSASSVPQLLYLAYKNRGQFLLDVARHQVPNQKASRPEVCQYYAKSCKEGLQQFAKALERDDTDLDSWKKAARVADVLSTQRISRFCLESVLAGEDEDGEQTIDLSGLDEAFAAGELEEVLELVQDDLSRLQSSDAKPKETLLSVLKKSNDPYPFLPKHATTLEYPDDRYRPLSVAPGQISLRPSSPDLYSLGEEIFEIVEKLEEGTTTLNGIDLSSATTIKIDLTTTDHEVEMAPTSDSAAKEGDIPGSGQDEASQSPVQDPAETGIEIEPLPEKDSPRDQVAAETGEAKPRENEKMGFLPDGDTIEERSFVAAPSRKRSTTVAGNDETEGRAKSKRLRARESMADQNAQEDEASHEDPQYFLEQLAIFEQADQATFDVANSLLTQLGMELYLSTEQAKQAFWTGTDEKANERGSESSQEDLQLSSDLRLILMSWSDDKGHAIVNGHGTQDFLEKASGMSLFLQHLKPAIPKEIERPRSSDKVVLGRLVTSINAEHTNIYKAASSWLSAVLTGSSNMDKPCPSPYLSEKWSVNMKHMVGELARTMEGYLWELFRQRLSSLSKSSQEQVDGVDSEVRSSVELVQTLFEMFLDTAAATSDLGGDIDHADRIRHADRMKRWSSLASEFMQLYLNNPALGLNDPLILRFIWASVAQARLDDNVAKEHIVSLLEELKALLEKTNADPIFLPNNTVMSVISVAAIDRELSALSTRDFFTSVFDDDNNDPVAVIEKLEPILESTPEPREGVTTFQPLTQAEELIQFLESGDAALKLYLWRRLQNAYTAILYTPKVVSCLLRSIETIVKELYTTRHLEMEPTIRQISMLKWLHDADEMMIRVLAKVLTDSSPFECVDGAHLRSSLEAVVRLVKLLHGFVIYEDSTRVGQSTGPQLKGANSTKLYEKSKDRFREMLVRAWTLQYTLLKEATVQEPSLYPRAADDLAEYLCTVHNSFGVRQYCKYANKSFVKLVKSELGNLATEQDYTGEIAQVFFDLYQLRIASGVGDVDHGCPPENLDKKTAWSLIPTIMKYAERFNVRDLNKSELKATIDKMQQALGVMKSPPTLQQNKRIISSYLKSIVNANDLYRCIRGIGDLPTRVVQADTQIAANSGWYFMLGHLTLSKYKSIKRVNPTPTDDLDVAASFFRQDLDHNIERWESWYRLAQVYEAKIEDDLIWNSTKLNESRTEIALLERQAIHSYIMATAVALRSADNRPETVEKVEDMLTEFATRLYASSRPPLNMEAFRTDKHIRHMSSIIDMRMSKQPYHKPVGQYSLWHFAAYLLGRKLTDRPKPWTSHYTRAKCLWKMFRSSENRGRVTAEAVVEAIIEAIDALPKKEKSNEPILEPHFKLVSIVHKMVRKQEISHAQAYQYLQASRYAEGVPLPEDEQGVDWVGYMLDILKKLGHADKSNWHHRITDRAAHVIFDDDPTVAGALGAKHQFTQQIFTKTMTMQVWKPEFERPGRHYVYTGRYISFFVHLLEQLSDRANLDLLVRRVRRKTGDFLDHTAVWEEVATTYVRLLRRLGKIPEGRERALFDGMNHEEFTKKSEMMEKWAHDPDTTSVYLDIMRDGIDLKRLNNSLLKGPVIDDLIGDSYACLYDEFIKQLPPEDQPKPQPAALPQGTFINMTTDFAAGGDDAAERARLANVLRAQGDGAADGPLSVSISAPVGLGLQNSPTPFSVASGQPIPEVQRERARPGRTKTVTRREIQRKAEAAIVKPPPIKTPILSKQPIVELPSKTEVGTEAPIDKRLAETKDEDIDGSRASSRRGSIQDSADGEADAEDSGSELSELEDMDEDKKHMLEEYEISRENADDGGEDAAEDAAEDNDGTEDDDEEMHDAEDEIEIQDSQGNIGNVARENKGSSPGDDEQEFHEARQEHTDTVD